MPWLLSGDMFIVAGKNCLLTSVSFSISSEVKLPSEQCTNELSDENDISQWLRWGREELLSISTYELFDRNGRVTVIYLIKSFLQIP